MPSKPDAPAAARTKRPVEIAGLLLNSILRGEISPGERLPPERTLALQFSTNRNTLREALRTLEALGLTRTRHGDGVRVLDFRMSGQLGLLPYYMRVATSDEGTRMLADLLRFRATMSLEVAGLAARRGESQDFKKIHDLLDALEVALRRNDMKALGKLELDLYRALAVASQSIAALWLLNGLEPVVRDLLEASPELWTVPEGYLETWRNIASALTDRDDGRARRLLSELLDRGDRRLLDLLDPEHEPSGYARRQDSTSPVDSTYKAQDGRVAEGDIQSS